MSEWKNEDDIKAELRILTGELKQLREELRDMVAPPKANPTRAFLHRQSWPPPSGPRAPEVVAKAEERKHPAGKRRPDKRRGKNR